MVRVVIVFLSLMGMGFALNTNAQCTGLHDTLSPIPGNVIVSPAFGGPSTVFTLTDTGYSASPMLSFLWQYSTDSCHNWQDVPSGWNPTITFTGIVATTSYRLVLVCNSNSRASITPGCPTIYYAPTSVGEVFNKSGVAIYPNPSYDEVVLETNSENYKTYLVSNSLGQIFISGVLNNLSTTIDITKLAPGIYFATMIGDGLKTTMRFVKM